MVSGKFERYAIFYTPPPGEFADAGARWLGWDSAQGCEATQPQVAGLDVARLTRRPRKYGFHATLKAPFYLAPEQDADALVTAVATFAAHHKAQPTGPLLLRADHGFVALRPRTTPQGLRELAAAAVRAFDGFRAPLSDEDLARRRSVRLSPRQDAQLLRYGYPHIFEDFHFHMTLTGPLRGEREETVLTALQGVVDPALPANPVVDAITLMGQDAGGMFHQIACRPLRG